MKKVFSFLLVTLFAVTLFSQNKTDEKGRKQGVWSKTNKKGVKLYEGTFIDDKETGVFKYYYQSGKLRAITEFSDDGHKGKTTNYYPDGQVMAEGFYFDRKQDSLWKTYTQDGKKLSENFYCKGSKEGTWKVWNRDGKIVEEIHYSNNKKNGLCLQGTFDGGYFNCNYKDDLRDGEYKEYYRTGELRVIGQYKADKKEGVWSIYDDTQVIAKQTFVNDIQISFEVALVEAEKDRFVDIESISYFYSKGKQTVVVLNNGENVNVLKDYQYLVELSDGATFLRLNEKLNLYASLQALKGIEATDDGNYYIKLYPEPPFKVVTDENSKKAMEFIFAPQDF
ncbi:MAG: hypothetical protein LBR28_06785 [Bacteroidales bacterium]|jgi:antitoxin component YwqK of YwqJK toxin-antitoxin module|nr:hypothetical protein [Bacteroidales bacterium]